MTLRTMYLSAQNLQIRLRVDLEVRSTDLVSVFEPFHFRRWEPVYRASKKRRVAGDDARVLIDRLVDVRRRHHGDRERRL